MKKLIFSALLPFLCLTSYAQGVLDIVVNSPDHNTLETAVIAAELADDLAGDGPFTIFAPTDAAFAAIDPATLNTLLADPTGDLATILLHHVVAGYAGTSNVSDGTGVGNLIAQNLFFGINGSTVTINGVNVSVLELRADNGVVHVIDAVLIPEFVDMTPIPATIMDVVSTSPVHTTLNTLINAAELDDDLSSGGTFTLFAPTDDAFAALPTDVTDALLADPTGALADILLYHATVGVASTENITDGSGVGSISGRNLIFAVNASGVSVNGVNISVLDIKTGNGVIHVLDAVLVP